MKSIKEFMSNLRIELTNTIQWIIKLFIKELKNEL